ncbi:hypothetical protein HaLaN_09007, partial [Haematococcus lacustris]
LENCPVDGVRYNRPHAHRKASNRLSAEFRAPCKWSDRRCQTAANPAPCPASADLKLKTYLSARHGTRCISRVCVSQQLRADGGRVISTGQSTIKHCS